MKHTYSILLLVFAIACSSTNMIEQMKNEAIAIHDEVMPKMRQVNNLKAELESCLDSLAVGAPYSETDVQEAIEALTAADKGMMDWMHSFHEEVTSAGDQVSEAVLEKQKTAVEKVKTDILSSLETGETILNAIGPCE